MIQWVRVARYYSHFHISHLVMWLKIKYCTILLNSLKSMREKGMECAKKRKQKQQQRLRWRQMPSKTDESGWRNGNEAECADMKILVQVDLYFRVNRHIWAKVSEICTACTLHIEAFRGYFVRKLWTNVLFAVIGEHTGQNRPKKRACARAKESTHAPYKFR